MNTAGRLLSIYDKLIQGRPLDKSMVLVWAEVFGLSHTAPHVEDDVVTCLQATRSEIELLRGKLGALGVTDDLLNPGLSRFRNITSTVYLNQQWNGLREEASKPENRISLLWANWTLRNEDEEDMAEDSLIELKGELDSLESSLHDADMTPYLRGFVQRQIDAIRIALRVYRVRGVKPIEEALQQMTGIYAIEKVRVEAEYEKASEPTKTVLARAGAFIKKTSEIADQLDKIRKSGEGTYTLAAGITPILLSWGNKLLT